MSILSQVTKGKISQPILAVVYGPDSVGKSTIGAEAPNPIFLGTERGTYNLDVARLPSPNSLDDVSKAIEALTLESHAYQTLVIDSLDWMEPLLWEQVVSDQANAKVKSIEDIGYAKGYEYALEYWKSMQRRLTTLRDKKQMNILLIAHCTIKEAKDPSVTEDYNRYQLKLHHKAAALWREYVDMVLFANFETLTAKDKAGKVRAFGEGSRYLYTERRPGFDAKSRFNIPFQIEMIKGETWKTLIDAVNADQVCSPDALIAQVHSLLEAVTDQDQKAKLVKKLEEMGQDTQRLDAFKSRLKDYLNA